MTNPPAMSDKQNIENIGITPRRRSPWRRAAIVTAWVTGSLILLLGIAAGVMTYMLTPRRLTPIVNRELSKYLAADVTTYNVRFTFWSSFPHLHIEMDSVLVMSRTLDSLPPAQRNSLPADARMLLRTGRFEGGINISQLMHDRIVLRDIAVDSLRVNLLRVTDSVANWQIIPPSKSSGIPYFTANSIRLTNPQPIHFRNLSMAVNASMDLDSVSVNRVGNSNDYDLFLGGNADALVRDIAYLHDFPIGLDGRLSLSFHPFRARTDNISVILGNTKGRVNVDLEMENGMKLNSFGYKLDEFNLEQLLKMFPLGQYEFLNHIRADLNVQGNLRLTKPYDMEQPGYPSAFLSLLIPDGSLSYDNPKRGNLRLSDVQLKASVALNGDNPPASVLYLNRLDVRGFGTDLSVRGVVRDLGSDPGIAMEIRGNAPVSGLTAISSFLQGLDLKGNFSADTRIRFRLSDLKEGRFEGLAVRGHTNLKDFQVGNLGTIERFSVGDMRINFDARARQATRKYLLGSLFDFDVDVDNLMLRAAGCEAAASDVTFSSRVSDRSRVAVGDLASEVPFDVALKASSLSLGNPGDTLRIKIKDADIRGQVSARMHHQVKARRFQVNVRGSSLSYRLGQSRFNINDLNLSLIANYLNHDVVAPSYKVPGAWHADDYSASFARHTPRMLKPAIPDQLCQIMKRWRVLLKIRGSRGMLLAPAFPVRNYLTGIDLNASFDSVMIHNLSMRSQSTAVKVSGGISNLRQFLTSTTPAPIRLKLYAAIDTLQCNQLSAAYTRGVAVVHGPGAFERQLNNTAVLPSDSVAMLIPRNVFADIRASINHSVYTNLHINGISGHINVGNGVVNVDSLQLHTDFMNIAGHLAYDTADLQDLGFRTGIQMKDLDVSGFFRNFPKVLRAFPEGSNLSGVFNANAEVSLKMFPSMYLMTPSTLADIHVDGRNLTLRQNRFIRHITSMMMIPDDGPLHFDNISLHASILDNLLRVYPFNLKFDRYNIRMGGLNNFDGDMFYHIGIMHWPLPLPFGINIKGNFSNPHVRFGSARWKDIRATELANSVMDHLKVNMLSQTRHAVNVMVRHAALSDTTSSDTYVFK